MEGAQNVDEWEREMRACVGEREGTVESLHGFNASIHHPLHIKYVGECMGL